MIQEQGFIDSRRARKENRVIRMTIITMNHVCERAKRLEHFDSSGSNRKFTLSQSIASFIHPVQTLCIHDSPLFDLLRKLIQYYTLILTVRNIYANRRGIYSYQTKHNWCRWSWTCA